MSLSNKLAKSACPKLLRSALPCYTEGWLKNNQWSTLDLAERKRNYELVVALSPVATEAEASAIVDNISEFITSSGGEVKAREEWGVKRLSYLVKNYQEGSYYKADVTMESSNIKELERTLNANQDVLLHLISKA
ncbi:30S ribosomal protein S6 [Chloroflexi bacterium]|nr:30S ribosomal protein S6 [Chloroflexota bacterium]